VPWNEFLLPILAGYIFINIWSLTRFRAQRHDGYRLLIESLFYGVLIFGVARILGIVMYKSYRVQAFEHWRQQNGLVYPYSGTALLAACLAGVVALLANWAIGRDRAKEILLARSDNGFLRLFNLAAVTYRMVSVTLSNRKVYIGYVLRAPNLRPEDQFVGLLPVVSGYRDKDTLRLVVTTNYAPAIQAQKIPASDFEITFALSAVDTANLFDPNLYPLFEGFAPDQAPSDQSSQATTNGPTMPLLPPPAQ
jgi:hypothetical protein